MCLFNFSRSSLSFMCFAVLSNDSALLSLLIHAPHTDTQQKSEDSSTTLNQVKYKVRMFTAIKTSPKPKMNKCGVQRENEAKIFTFLGASTSFTVAQLANIRPAVAYPGHRASAGWPCWENPHEWHVIKMCKYNIAWLQHLHLYNKRILKLVLNCFYSIPVCRFDIL